MRTLIRPAATLILWATVVHGQPPKPAPKVETPTTITINKPIKNVPLREVAEFLADKHGITVTINSVKVAKGEKPFGDLTVNVPHMSTAPVGFLVEYLAQAAGATSRKAEEKYIIEAGKPKDLAALLAAPSPSVRAKAGAIVTFNQPIANLPLKELLDFLSEKYDVDIVLDEAGFQRVKQVLAVGQRPISIAIPATTVENLLRIVVGPLGGKVVVREEMILIVPDGKPGS